MKTGPMKIVALRFEPGIVSYRDDPDSPHRCRAEATFELDAAECVGALPEMLKQQAAVEVREPLSAEHVASIKGALAWVMAEWADKGHAVRELDLALKAFSEAYP